MATINTFPPDVPKDWDEAEEETKGAAGTLRAKAANVADKATETVKDGYYRARDAWSETDTVETAREGGEAMMRAVERHPLIAFGLGALSVGLVAWAALREQQTSRWERYQPDYGRLRGLFQGYANDAAKSGQSAVKSGQSWLNAYGSDARDYAEHGGRYLAHRAQKEPIAALLGVGIAVYVIGSLLTSSSGSEQDGRRASSRR